MTFMSTTGQAPVPPAGPRGPLGPLLMTPGRWVALAVGVPVALALIGWTGFNLVTTVARGSYPFSYAIPVQDGQVAVNINAGNVTLREAPGSSTARLTGTVQYGLIRPGIGESITPTGASIDMSCDGINTDCGMSGSLDIPAQTAVTLWSNGGDITASGFSSGMSLSAAGGNVTATNLQGDLRLDSGGGDLSANGLTGTLQIATEGGNVNAGAWAGTGTTRVDTGGGDMTVNGLTGNFQMSTEGGNVDASGVASALVGMDSGGGNVTLALTQVPQNLQISTEGGNVTVILPLGSTTYDISTPDNLGANISYPQSLFSSTSTHKITIDSAGGDITVSQA
ncbi:MAG TPA: hypothetical protein VJ347_04485 [Streptosporangiaceae bacterium]|jgi:Toastrack DUF4097|nr:hypothetical protein [Streptosporangiaceae bacterium]